MRHLDTLYYERAGGRYEAWTYSDGQRVAVLHGSEERIQTYAKKYHYRLLKI